jgi:hypothetical protein
MGVLSYKGWFQLNEKMGVPSGIEDAGQKIYNSTISTLKDPSVQSYIDDYIIDKTRPTFDIPVPEVSYGDETIRVVKHTIEFHDHLNQEPAISSLSVSNGGSPIRGSFTKMKNSRDSVVEVTTHMVFDFEKYRTEDAIEYLEGANKTEYISSLSHELMHEYDNRKRHTTSFKDRARYKAESSFRAGVKQIDDFLHRMYFLNAIESVVRPAQVLTKLKKDGVTKSGFLKALRDDRTWKELEEAKEFTVEGLIEETANDERSMARIREVLDTIDGWDLVKGDKDDNKALVDAMLKLVFINLVNMNAEDLHKSIRVATRQDPFMAILSGDKMTQAHDDMMKDLVKYRDNHIGYYKNAEKYFKLEADRVMRKISKLYDMMPEDNKPDDKSIIDRELHQKINDKKSDVTDTEIKESFTFDEFIDEDKDKSND